MSALATVPTPLGPFTAVVDAEGAVLASGWTDDADALLALVHAELRPTDPARREDLGEVTAAVAAFHDGDPGPAAAVPVRQISGPATTAIWERLRTVPAGAPTTYGELADAAGYPKGHRIAARACVHNAATLFVPVPPRAAPGRWARRVPLGAGAQGAAAGPRGLLARR